MLNNTYLERNSVNLWQIEAELRKILVWAFRGSYSENGIGEAM